MYLRCIDVPGLSTYKHYGKPSQIMIWWKYILIVRKKHSNQLPSNLDFTRNKAHTPPPLPHHPPPPSRRDWHPQGISISHKCWAWMWETKIVLNPLIQHAIRLTLENDWSAVFILGREGKVLSHFSVGEGKRRLGDGKASGAVHKRPGTKLNGNEDVEWEGKALW